MKNNWYQFSQEQWSKWRKQRPLQMRWGGLAVIFIFYYLLVILPLNNMININLKKVEVDKNQVEWMAKAGQKIYLLRQTDSGKKKITQEPVFTVINKMINEQEWASLVTDLRQVDENRVQVHFKAIAFTDLIRWILKLYDEHGIFVSETVLQKMQPGVVNASLVFEVKAQK